MCYKEHSFAPSSTTDGIVEEVGAHVGINGTERVVQEQYGPVAVQGTCQAHSLTLPTTQVSTSLPNLEQEKWSKNTEEYKVGY